ncbi:MAG TPA: hypothetical protein DD670_14895 [Planctomycetaceae bacterium]|nr:hypothetical protein [Planctomycetaceae bacterium]
MSTDQPELQTDVAIAMVATSSARLPDASRVLAACGVKGAAKGGLLGSIFGRKPAPSDEHQWEDGNLVFPLRGAFAAISLMPAPIPWSGLEGPCATAWWWPEATEQMQRHTNHFLVTILGGDIEPIERRVVLTRAVREGVRGTDAVGVYWGEGTLVHEPDHFARMAKSVSVDDIPGPLWIDVRVEPNADGSHRCFTTGLAPLGFMEIEVRKSGLQPSELFEFVGDSACYIVNRRMQIPDGDTMGRTATEKYKVRHGESMFDRPTVMQLVME